jgi:hypothetical protein
MVQGEKLCSFAYPKTQLHALLENVGLRGDFEGNRLVCVCCDEPLSEGNIGGVFFDEHSHCGLAVCHKVDRVDRVGKLVVSVPIS